MYRTHTVVHCVSRPKTDTSREIRNRIDLLFIFRNEREYFCCFILFVSPIHRVRGLGRSLLFATAHPGERLKPKTFYAVLPNIRPRPPGGWWFCYFFFFFFLGRGIAEPDGFSLSRRQNNNPRKSHSDCDDVLPLAEYGRPGIWRFSIGS